MRIVRSISGMCNALWALARATLRQREPKQQQEKKTHFQLLQVIGTENSQIVESDRVFKFTSEWKLGGAVLVTHLSSRHIFLYFTSFQLNPFNLNGIKCPWQPDGTFEVGDRGAKFITFRRHLSSLSFKFLLAVSVWDPKRITIGLCDKCRHLFRCFTIFYYQVNGQMMISIDSCIRFRHENINMDISNYLNRL